MEMPSSFIVFFMICNLHAGTTLVHGSLKSIEKAADDVAQSVVKVVVDQVRNVEDISATLNQKVPDGTLLGKIRNGAYDIKKGLATGAAEVVGTPVDLKQLTFYLVKAKNLEKTEKINFFKPEKVAQTKGKIIFLIHGWKSDMNTSWYHDLSQIFIRKQPDTHMVQVNWDKPAKDLYPFSAFDTESVGNYVGILINRLVTEYEIPIDNIILIGHSLGAQTAGFAGKLIIKMTGRKLPRIIALDPAGPLFILRPNSKRLNKDDAEVVMVIHTDAGVFGYPTNIGTIDFYPNGGANQPGCWKLLKALDISTYKGPVTCDHSRAWELFVEAVNNTDSFPALKCKSYKDFENDKCEGEVVTMGDMETKNTGSFYLKTNSKKPFSQALSQRKLKENGNLLKNMNIIA